MSEYRDIQTAVRVEKFRVWFGWLAGSVILLIIGRATQYIHIHVVSIVTPWLLVGLFLLLTITAVRMTNALNRKALAARREVLGDDL